VSVAGIAPYGADLYTEPEGDPDTLANLGPLAALAGVWEGTAGADEHPVDPADPVDPAGQGIERDVFVERHELHPIDPQTNGPQLLYGLRYHTHIVKPGEVETFHDQVGYWLWEPATGTVMLTLAIPRGQVLLAGGTAEPDATSFEVRATRGSEVFGISSGPFLDRAFRTISYRMAVHIHPDGSWSYEEEGVLEIPDRVERFSHIDRNTLVRVAPPTPNPLAQQAGAGAGTVAGDSAAAGVVAGDVAGSALGAAVQGAGLGIGSLRGDTAQLL
jgi:hypothetical protein